jgi:hypothetical protein
MYPVICVDDSGDETMRYFPASDQRAAESYARMQGYAVKRRPVYCETTAKQTEQQTDDCGR